MVAWDASWETTAFTNYPPPAMPSNSCSTGQQAAAWHNITICASITPPPMAQEIKEDMLYHHRAYYFNNEVHGMHYGEFANYTDYFAQAILNDQTDFSPNLREGIETFCIMEAIRQSAQTGKPVQVSDYLREGSVCDKFEIQYLNIYARLY